MLAVDIVPRTHLDRRGSYREPKTTLRSHRQHTTTHSASHALQGMHISKLPRQQRRLSRPSHGYTGHWRADYILSDTSSATHLSHLPQPATDIRVRKARSASASHRHAVDRGDVVDAARARLLRASHEESMVAHVAACHGQTRRLRLGGGGGTSAGKAVVRGGGHEVAKSAAKARPAV